MNICPFSKYKNFLGSPLKGIHSYRFQDVAIIDYILTIVIAFITTFFTKIPLVLATIGWFIIGIILHIMFGVETNTSKYLGMVCKS